MKTALPSTGFGSIILLFAALICYSCSSSDMLFQLDSKEQAWLGEKIFQNECNKQTACLITWNNGEDFPSLGIGHFIWYHKGQVSPFEETFPQLIEYMHKQGAAIPPWIPAHNPDSPWRDREQFLSKKDSERQTELRHFLEATMSLQAGFIVERFSSTIVEITQSSSNTPEHILRQKVRKLAAVNPPQGLFAMIDYMHFKGSGLAASERYNDQGWGLLQVLEHMQNTDKPLESFVASGRSMLERRVRNSPADRNEQQWLQGWYNRMDGYLQEPML